MPSDAPNSPEFEVVGDLSDEAIEALAQLLVEAAEEERPGNHEEACQEPRS